MIHLPFGSLFPDPHYTYHQSQASEVRHALSLYVALQRNQLDSLWHYHERYQQK